MLLKKLILFLKNSPNWIAASIVSGLAAGLVAAFFFNPFVVTYSIKNINEFFDIENLRLAKAEVIGTSVAIVNKISDPSRARALQNILGNAQWMENNVTPVLAITKTDVRDIVDFQNNKSIKTGNVFSIINFKECSENAQLARDNLKFISSYILRLIQRYRLSNWLNLTKIKRQNALTDINEQMPNISLLIEANRERQEVIKNIIVEDQSTANDTPIYIFLNQGQSNGNKNTNPQLNNEDKTNFLPIKKQLTGMKVNLSDLEITNAQLRFRRDVEIELYERAIEAEYAISALDLTDPGVLIDLPENFWREGKISDFLKKAKGLRLEYLEDILRSLEVEQRHLHSDFKQVATQDELVEYKHKFNRLVAIVAGLLAGLVMPLIVFFMIQMSKEEEV